MSFDGGGTSTRIFSTGSEVFHLNIEMTLYKLTNFAVNFHSQLSIAVLFHLS